MLDHVQHLMHDAHGRVVTQAEEILSVREGLSPEEAVALLRADAAVLGIPISELAEDLVRVRRARPKVVGAPSTDVSGVPRP